jgi:hypothetical protein
MSANQKKFVRIFADGTTSAMIMATSPARGAMKSFRGEGDDGAVILVELDRGVGKRGSGVYRYSVGTRAITEQEMMRDQFLAGGRIKHKKIAMRQRLLATDAEMVKRIMQPSVETSDVPSPPAVRPLRRFASIT